MKQIKLKRSFQPQPPDEAGVVSWVHLGDLHMTTAGEQNHLDLAEIVDEVNSAFARSVSFVFLPGDVADDGSRAAYEAVRAELDRLTVPWCAIIGDHDVHDPASFTVSADQLAWVKRELQTATGAGMNKVLLLHCYPSDLKVGGAELMELLRTFGVSLIDMGHTHYNEIANDGRTLYSATRSTGQIEEGPVGYSVTSVDGNIVSWRFVELGKLPVVVITSPSDERLLTSASKTPKGILKVRAMFWGEAEAVHATAHLAGRDVPMERVQNSRVWEATISPPPEGVHSLLVSIEDALGTIATDEIRVTTDSLVGRERAERDQDNALKAWPEHGLRGTQLGPNKNGKKW